MSQQESTVTPRTFEVAPRSYFLSHHTTGASFEEVRREVTDRLKEQGFGILTTIDVAQTMKEKLGKDLAPYVILGACNPPLAFKALQEEPGIGALLPCNVVVAQEKDGVFVGAVDPESLFSVVESEGMRPLAVEVKERLSRALSGLSA